MRRDHGVISVYKVANFPDGGGHFWVYMQYARGCAASAATSIGWSSFALRRSRSRDSSPRELLRRMRPSARRKDAPLFIDEEEGRVRSLSGFVGCEWPGVEAVLRRADLLLNFHYAIDPV